MVRRTCVNRRASSTAKRFSLSPASALRGTISAHVADDARRTEPDQRVVMARPAPAPGLPPVDDLALVPEGTGAVAGRLGPQQVLLLAEELVARRGHACAEPAGG